MFPLSQSLTELVVNSPIRNVKQYSINTVTDAIYWGTKLYAVSSLIWVQETKTIQMLYSKCQKQQKEMQQVME